MAVVPRLTEPSVEARPAPNIQLQSAANAGLMTIGARQAQQAGQSMVGLGGVLEQQRHIFEEQANALRVDDAYNLATEAAIRLQHDPKEGYSAAKGYDALSRESGMPLAEEFGGKLDQKLGEIAATLGNDTQRARFQMRSNDLRTRFRGEAMKYEGGQQQEYTLSVREATVKNAANIGVINAGDPDNIRLQTFRIRGAIEGGVDPDSGVFIPGAAQIQGKSAAWAREKADEAVSGMHTGAVQKFMESGNVSAAMAYRKRYGSEFTAADMLKIDGHLERNYETMRGLNAATQTVQSAQPNLQPNDWTRVLAVRTRLESGGRGDFGPDGTLLRGPVTKNGEQALGSAQVMPSTAKDPGYGIRPADLSGTPQQQAAELRRVGDEKMAVLFKMFDGDIGKAFAAYNWGEGNVQKAVRAARDNAGRGEAVPADAWLASAPKETRDYVAKATAMLANPATSAPAKPTEQQLVQAARERLGPNASPVAVKVATDEISRQFALQTQATTQRKEEIVTAALQEVAQNGGSFAKLSPSMRAKLTELAPDKLDDIQSYAGKIAAGQPIETDWNAYTQLRAMAAQEPAGFAKTDLRRFYDRLAPAHREHLLDLQTSTKDPTKLPEVATLEAQINNARSLMALKGENAGKFDTVVTNEINAATHAKGKPLTYEERQKVIDRNMLVVSEGGWFSATKRVYEVAGTAEGLTAKPVPTSGDRDLIKAALAAEGVKNPTDAQIVARFNLKNGIR